MDDAIDELGGPLSVIVPFVFPSDIRPVLAADFFQRRGRVDSSRAENVILSVRVERETVGNAEYDGYVTYFVPSVDSAMRLLDELPAMWGDDAAFLAPEEHRILTECVVAREMPRSDTSVKLVEWCPRHPSLTPTQFRDHWVQVHAPLAIEHIAQLRRYSHSFCIAPQYARATPKFDGVVEVWMDSAQSVKDSEASPGRQRLLDDEPNFIDAEGIPFMMVREMSAAAPL